MEMKQTGHFLLGQPQGSLTIKVSASNPLTFIVMTTLHWNHYVE